jgi:hypothetical protein
MEDRPVNRVGEPGSSAAGRSSRSSASSDPFKVASGGSAQTAEGPNPPLARRAADSSLTGLSEARVDALARLLIRALDNETPVPTQSPPNGEEGTEQVDAQGHPGVALYLRTQNLVK